MTWSKTSSRSLLLRADELAGPENDGLGCELDARGLLDEYVEDRLRFARSFSTDMRIVVDAANGSACSVAGRILEGTGASVDVRFCEPDGVNINLECGATAPQALARIVAETNADLGFALDGDADRCVAVDERGEVVDGDQLIGIIALDRLARNALPQGIVVASVLSNGGLEKALIAAGGKLARTPVGDKYILDGMMVMDAGLGGEKSGHVIIRDRANAGDGLVTALEILSIIARTGQAAERACNDKFRCFLSSRGRSTFVTRTSGRQIRPLPEPSRRRGGRSLGAAESSSGHRALSRRCGSWSRARKPRPSRRWPTRSRRLQQERLN